MNDFGAPKRTLRSILGHFSNSDEAFPSHSGTRVDSCILNFIMSTRCVVGLIFALIGCLLPIPTEAQQQVFILADDISFSILPSRRSYKIGERIEFVYRVRNVSHAPLFVPRRVWSVRCPAITPPYVWAGLEDFSGRHYMPGYGGDCLGPTKIGVRERMQKDAVLLKPGQVFQNSFQLETSMFVGKLMPGEYRLEATLYGWRDKDFTQAERATLTTFGHPFIIGQPPASTTIKLAF